MGAFQPKVPCLEIGRAQPQAGVKRSRFEEACARGPRTGAEQAEQRALGVDLLGGGLVAGGERQQPVDQQAPADRHQHLRTPIQE